MTMEPCPICDSQADRSVDQGEEPSWHRFNCPNCGRFRITHSALGRLPALSKDSGSTVRAVLSHKICTGQDGASPVRILVADLEAAKTAALPDANRSCEFLLIYLKNHQQSLGTFMEIAHGHLRAKIGVVNIADESFILQSAISEGLVEQRDQPGMYNLRLTWKGRAHVEKSQRRALRNFPTPMVSSASTITDAIDGGRTRDVFISHASEDKLGIARPLAEDLVSNNISVWFDEYELRWGDSLREKIDDGLAHARFGVVILSSHFFAKRWPKAELDGLFAAEVQGTKILPIWHNVTQDDVAKFSPILAGRLAKESNRCGISQMVAELKQMLEPPHPEDPPNEDA